MTANELTDSFYLHDSSLTMITRSAGTAVLSIDLCLWAQESYRDEMPDIAPLRVTLSGVRELIKKNARAHVAACTGSADSLDEFELNWLATTISDAVLQVVARDDDPQMADRHITSLLGFIRLGADAFLPQRI